MSACKLRREWSTLKPLSQRQRESRDSFRDDSVPLSGKEKSRRVDLGIALLHAAAVPGVAYDYDEIAAWAGCLPGMVFMIERKALQKLRNRLRFIKDPRLVQMIDHLFDERQPATLNSQLSTTSAE